MVSVFQRNRARLVPVELLAIVVYGKRYALRTSLLDPASPISRTWPPAELAHYATETCFLNAWTKPPRMGETSPRSSTTLIKVKQSVRHAAASASRSCRGVCTSKARPPQHSARAAKGHGTVSVYRASGKNACSISHRELLKSTITGL